MEGSQPTKAASVTIKDLTVEPSERGGGGTLQKCGTALEKEQRVAKWPCEACLASIQETMWGGIQGTVLVGVSHEPQQPTSQGKGAGGGDLETQADKTFHRCLRYLKLSCLLVFWIFSFNS